MIEVEIRAKVKSFDSIKRRLAELGAKLEKTMKQVDQIYGREKDLDSEHKIIDGALSSRIREVNGKKRIDFKEIVRKKSGFDLSIDITDVGVGQRFLEKLDFEEAFTLRKTRETYSYRDFTICLDDVETLGLFIEIEKTLASYKGAERARNGCVKVLRALAPRARIEHRKYGDLMQELKNKNINSNLRNIFRFLHQISRLKNTLRFSEVPDIPRDSSTDHSWRLALMTFVLADELKLNINIEKAIKLALVHDLAESVTGNTDYILIADGKVSKENVHEQHIDAIKKLKTMLPKNLGQEIFSLWVEYDADLSREAKYTKALSKLETLTYLTEIGWEYYDKPELIANYADKAVSKFPELKDVLKEIKERLKAEFEKGGFEWKPEYDKV